MTSCVATMPGAFWGAYGASKAAFEALLLSYGDEVKAISNIRVAIVDPGATATAMRAKAYPGEDAATIQPADQVGARIAQLVGEGFERGFRLRIAGSARG